MRVAVLFSGGKDSTLALHRVAEREQIVCLITLISGNKESYMFHTPNIDITKLQAKAMDFPLVRKYTEGKKEEELEDLADVLKRAKRDFGIDGVVTGAIESVYQAARVQRICDDLGLCCLNPLWKTDQKDLLKEIVKKGFKVIVCGVFAYPLDKSWLGREIDMEMVEKSVELGKKYGINPSGEGGEIETTVLDAPLFRKKIKILDFKIEADGDSGIFSIKKASLSRKGC